MKCLAIKMIKLFNLMLFVYFSCISNVVVLKVIFVSIGPRKENL